MVLRVLYTFLSSTLPLVNLFILKRLIDAVTMGATGVSAQTAFLPYLVAMVVVFLANRIVSALNSINNDVLSQRLIDYMSDLVQRQAAELDMAHYDTPAYHDIFHRAGQEAVLRPLQILGNFLALGGALISIVIVGAMLLETSPWVVVAMIVAVVPSFLVRLRKARAIYAFRRDNTQLYRRTTYYNTLLTSRVSAKEMRVFDVVPYFRKLFVEIRATLVSTLLRISRRLGAADMVCAIIEAAAMLLVVYLLAMQAFTKAISIGTFVMLFEAFRRGQGYLSALVNAIAGLYDSRLCAGNLFEFLNLRPTIKSPENPQAMPEKIESIELRDVTFSYPGMGHPVLVHQDFMATPGEVTHIDGCNGRGKTTILMLLLRLYDPQEGLVLINGIDIRRFDLRELRSRFGVLFQDFVRYQTTVAENLDFGEEKKERVLPDYLDFVGNLPKGEYSMLGRTFDDGSELSMGQWQRIALARALESDAPIIILDEPFAWIDAPTRTVIAPLIEEASKKKILIMISHV